MRSLKNFKRLINQHSKIIIYGAGQVARELFEWMKNEKINSKVSYFAVTYLGDNPTQIDDVPVRTIDSLAENNTDALVIVATLLNAQKEIGDTLQRLGFRSCTYITSNLRREMSYCRMEYFNRKIYLCDTYYHVLIALTMIEVNKEEADLFFSNGLERDYELQDRIIKSAIVDNIFRHDRGKVREVLYNSKLKRLLFGRRRLIYNFEKITTVDFSRYKGGVYMFFDEGQIARYIQAKHIKYTLLEDCYDFMKVVVPMKFMDRLEHTQSFWGKIEAKLGLDYVPLGQSKYCKKIEVNDLNGIAIPQRKVTEYPREKLIAKLTARQKEKIFKIFVGEQLVESSSNENTLLILTQPLFKDNFVPSLETQKQIYTDIIKENKNKFDVIYVKPHPRDDFPYEQIDCNIHVINKKIPTEVFNFMNRIMFKKAITISSTAIYNMNFVEEKELLGLNYISPYVPESERKNLSIVLP